MIKTTAIAAAVLVAMLAQADAGQRQYRDYYAGGIASAPVQLYPGYAAQGGYQGGYYGGYSGGYGYGGYYDGPRVGPGPIWSGPNECRTDEGYGRYGSCDSRGR